MADLCHDKEELLCNVEALEEQLAEALDQVERREEEVGELTQELEEAHGDLDGLRQEMEQQVSWWCGHPYACSRPCHTIALPCLLLP